MNAHHLYAQSVATRYAEFRATVVIPQDRDIDKVWRRPVELKKGGGNQLAGVKAERAGNHAHMTKKAAYKRRREW